MSRAGQDTLLSRAVKTGATGPAFTGEADLGFVGYDVLEAACRRLTARELAVALKDRFMPIAFGPEPQAYVAAGPTALNAAYAHGSSVVATADPRDFVAALQAIYGGEICGRAAGHLVQAAPEFSARWRLRPAQGAALAAGAVALALGWYAMPLAAAIVASVVFGIVFLAVCAIRLLGLLNAPPPPRPPQLGEAELPVYTVLVPLFRETKVLGQLIEALSRLDYPALGSKRTKA
ncbi:MAG: hypothetical protein WD928_02440 [Gammaproteobacteria bacterium]